MYTRSNKYNIKNNFFLELYTKLESKWCNHHSQTKYDSIEQAKVACSEDLLCKAVYDHGCDAEPQDIYTCSFLSIYQYDPVSCLYNKNIGTLYKL